MSPAVPPMPAAAPVRPTAADLVSTYVDDAFYEVLRTDAEEWRAVGRPLVGDERATVEGLLLAEAWLIDQARFEEWLDLYCDECLYWVPADPDVGDPQRHVTLACDDRRRLRDRIAWLRTGLAYAQIPPSRTAHQLSGHVVVPTAIPGELKVRSSFVVHERRTDDVRVLAGWCGHVLVPEGGELRIRRKVVVPIDAGAAQRNLSFLL